MLKSKQQYSSSHIKQYALNYLNKFGTSRHYLFNFLINKIKQKYYVPSMHLLQSDIEQVLLELTNLGFINDLAFSESRIKTLLREGNAIFHITLKLKNKGISQDTITEAFNNVIVNLENDSTIYDLEMFALCKYAKKRNLLLWQHVTPDTYHKEKVITSMSRKGFPYQIIENLLSSDINHDKEACELYLNNIETRI